MTSVIEEEQFQQLFANCVAGLTDTKIVKQIKFKGAGSKLEAKYSFQKQSCAKYLRQL